MEISGIISAIVIGLIIMAAVIFVEQAQRRIPVQYARRMVGRKMFGGSSTYIPLKVNQAGIIPVIFAASLMYLPAMAVQFNQNTTNPVVVWISKYMVTGDHWVYMAVYFAMVIFFTYFYVAITFDTVEVADNMKKYGGFIPGIRAGKPTEEYLNYVLSRITLPGALYLGLISLVPLIALVRYRASTWMMSYKRSERSSALRPSATRMCTRSSARKRWRSGALATSDTAFNRRGCAAAISNTCTARVSGRQATAHAVSPEPSPITAISAGAGWMRAGTAPSRV